MEKLQIERGPDRFKLVASLALGDSFPVVMWTNNYTPLTIRVRSIRREVGGGGGFYFTAFTKSHHKIGGFYRPDTREGWIETNALEAE